MQAVEGFLQECDELPVDQAALDLPLVTARGLVR